MFLGLFDYHFGRVMDFDKRMRPSSSSYPEFGPWPGRGTPDFFSSICLFPATRLHSVVAINLAFLPRKILIRFQDADLRYERVERRPWGPW